MKISGVSSIAEPDDFAVGTDLTNAFKGITLSVEGQPEKDVVVADGFSTFLGGNFASTGTRVFGTDPPNQNVAQGWDEEFGLLRIDFDRATDFVEIDVGDEGGSVATTLTAFDAAGNVIGQSQHAIPLYISPSLSFDDARISYAIVGGDDSLSAWLDNLRFNVVGSANADRMIGTNGVDHYSGLAGNDVIKGRGGDDFLMGGAGADTLTGGDGFDQVFGQDGDDLFLAPVDDLCDGGAGVDTASFAGAKEKVVVEVGGAFLAVENVIGSKFDDGIFDLFGGGPEGSFISGGKGNDTLTAGGPYQQFGGPGDDRLSTGFGDGGAELTGGGGKDTFELVYYFPDPERVINSASGSVIHDFRRGTDHLELTGIGENPFLTNEGDTWTIHHDDGSSSFQIVGVTTLDSSDYIFGV